MALIRRFKLDMVPGGMPLTINVSQYDSDFTFIFELCASTGTFLIPDGSTARIRGTKLDGTVYSVDAVLDASAKTVTVEGKQQITACAGINIFELTIYNNGLELNTANFILKVERAAADKDSIASDSVIRELVDVIDRTDEIIAAANQADAAQAAIADYAARAESAASGAESSASSAASSAESAASSMAAAEETIETAKNSATEAIAATRASALEDVAASQEAAISAVDKAYNAHIDTINAKAAQIATAKTNAEVTAATAASQASEANATASEAASMAEELQEQMQELRATVQNNVVANGYVSNDVGYYVNAEGNVIFTMTGIGGSGGSGGGGSSSVGAIFTCASTTGWLSKTVSTQNKSCVVSFNWSSVEDGVSTGQGKLIVTVGGVSQSMNIQQGDVSVDLAEYISKGINSVSVKIEDVYGQSRTTIFTVTVSELTISSSLDTSEPFTGAILFPYALTASVDHLVYFWLDGKLDGTYQTRAANKQLTYAIDAQPHGAHSLRVYFETTISGETVRSNELYYEFIALEDFNDSTIIASPFNRSSAHQYETLQIPVTAYSPSSLTTELSLYANGNLVSTQVVDRTEHSFSYRLNDAGPLTLRFAAGGAEKVITLNVEASNIDVEAETQSLALHLSSAGRSNGEANPGTWTYGTGAGAVAAVFDGFNFSSDGWQTDADGIPVLRVSGDARLTIPYKPFASDFKTGGKTIEIEFSTKNVLDYDAPVLSCMSGGIGLTLTAQKATLKSMQSEFSTQYKEDEHIRLALVVEKTSENRLAYTYLDGIPSGMAQYPATDIFAQETPVGIVIGSNACTIDIYCIRVYDNDLTPYQVLDNYIADTQDGYKMQELYTRNSVFDDYANIVIDKLPSTLPYIVVACDQLPTRKEDSFECSGRFVNPAYPSRSFTFAGASIKPQGTSSLGFPRKNYKIKFSGGFIMSGSSTAVPKYAMDADAIPTKTFCFKADFASSEGANNVELVRAYNDACPYKTPAQEEDSRVRQGIDGFPIAFFWEDTQTGETSFLGRYNFNNDKSTEEVFGLSGDDESWEIRVNGTDEAVFKRADFTSQTTDPLTGKTYYDWTKTFEARYPDGSEDKAQLQAFVEWAASTDTTAATGDALAESYTDADGTVHTVDDAAYRLAKFKTEAPSYMEMDSAIFYYIFTELFLMVDSRAKNMFPSFIGEEVSA